MHVSHITSNLGSLEGSHASKSDTIGSKQGGIIESGVKLIDEDAGSIKDVENVEDGDNNAAPEVGPATTGALEKEMIQGDPTDSHAVQFDMENAGLSSGVATAGEQGGNSEDSVKVTAC